MLLCGTTFGASLGHKQLMGVGVTHSSCLTEHKHKALSSYLVFSPIMTTFELVQGRENSWTSQLVKRPRVQVDSFTPAADNIVNGDKGGRGQINLLQSMLNLWSRRLADGVPQTQPMSLGNTVSHLGWAKADIRLLRQLLQLLRPHNMIHLQLHMSIIVLCLQLRFKTDNFHTFPWQLPTIEINLSTLVL